MRAKLIVAFLLIGVVALLLAPTSGLSQYGQPGSGGPGYSGRSGFGSGDPNRFFDMIARGKDVLIRSEMDPRWQGMLDRMGITGDQITRQQFVNAMQQGMASMGMGSRGGSSSGGSPMDKATDGQRDLNAEAEKWFRSRDKNGDGVLDNDELSSSLRAERATWDKNGDGFIDLNEYKEYFKARQQQRESERQVRENDQKPAQEDSRSVVYRANNLPSNIPSWFRETDTDEDGQIGLYEWKVKGWSIEEFEKRDRNNDGFLTIDEVLRYETFLVQQGQTQSGDNRSKGDYGRIDYGKSDYGSRGDSGRGDYGKSGDSSRSRGDYGRGDSSKGDYGKSGDSSRSKGDHSKGGGH